MTKMKEGGLIETRAQAEKLAGEIVEHQLKHNGAAVEMDNKIAQIKSQYIDVLNYEEEMINKKTLLLNLWASAHRDEFDHLKKSIEFAKAIIGFRLGNPKVEKLKSFKWVEIAKQLSRLSWGKNYVRTKDPEVDKDKLIADRGFLRTEVLKKVGLKIVQNDNFYVEPKTQELIQ